MFLITEEPLYTEAVRGKDLFIEGVFATAERKNKNGRIYPSSVLEREVNTFVESQIKNKTSTGELNHPETATVNPDRVSHLVTSMTKEGNDFIGKAKILNTPTGNIVKGLIEGGVRLGVSTRGLGSLTKKEEVSYVNEDFKLVTVDIVANPSNQTSFVNGILEGIEFVYEHGVLISKHFDPDHKQEIENTVEQIKDTVKKTRMAGLTEAKMNAFKQFMEVLYK